MTSPLSPNASAALAGAERASSWLRTHPLPDTVRVDCYASCHGNAEVGLRATVVGDLDAIARATGCDWTEARTMSGRDYLTVPTSGVLLVCWGLDQQADGDDAR